MRRVRSFSTRLPDEKFELLKRTLTPLSGAQTEGFKPPARDQRRWPGLTGPVPKRAIVRNRRGAAEFVRSAVRGKRSADGAGFRGDFSAALDECERVDLPSVTQHFE